MGHILISYWHPSDHKLSLTYRLIAPLIYFCLVLMLRHLVMLMLLMGSMAMPCLTHAQDNSNKSESVASEAPVDVESNETEEYSDSDSQEEALEIKEFNLPSEQHIWTRFRPGAWREIQITTETFDQDGKVINQSITTQKEVLKSFDEDSYTLEVQATVDLVGKRIVGDWKERILFRLTDSTGEILETDQLENSVLVIDGISQECQLWHIRYTEDGKQMLDKLFYYPEQFPYIFRRDSCEWDKEEQQILEIEDSTETLASNIPYVVDGSMIHCTSQKTLRKRQKGNTTRIVFVSPEIPGGEAAAWTSDFDTQGKINRWSTLKLINYGFGASEPK